MLNAPVKGKIQGLFKAFECFQVLLKANLIFKDFSRQTYIQVIIKHVRTPVKLFLNYRNVHHYPVRICLCMRTTKTQSDQHLSILLSGKYYDHLLCAKFRYCG